MTTDVRSDLLLFTPVFNSGLMAPHPYPFAYYVEAEGWTELAAMRGPRYHHYARLVPRTYQVAQSMYKHIHEIRRWGKQLSDGWVTETFGDWTHTRAALASLGTRRHRLRQSTRGRP